MRLVHKPSWGDGRLFGRSQKEGSRGRGGASIRQAQTEAGVSAQGGRYLGERVDPLADDPLYGLWPKKRTLGASERDEFVRAAFRVMIMSSIDSERLVFVDECSTNTSLAPLYGWARRGERVHQKVPRNWGKNV